MERSTAIANSESSALASSRLAGTSVMVITLARRLSFQSAPATTYSPPHSLAGEFSRHSLLL